VRRIQQHSEHSKDLAWALGGEQALLASGGAEWRPGLRLALGPARRAQPSVVGVGLGRIVALRYRSSTSYQLHRDSRCLYL
jgi:hypothetical protein